MFLRTGFVLTLRRVWRDTVTVARTAGVLETESVPIPGDIYFGVQSNRQGAFSSHDILQKRALIPPLPRFCLLCTFLI